MASQMWKQLRLVKEDRGEMGVILAHKVFYRYNAEEGVSITDHVTKLREMQEELNLMEDPITDKDFVRILSMLLLESWEGFIVSFMGARTKGTVYLSSHELVAMLLDEGRQRAKKSGGSQDIAMVAQGNGKKNLSDSDEECYNCKKKVSCPKLI